MSQQIQPQASAALAMALAAAAEKANNKYLIDNLLRKLSAEAANAGIQFRVNQLVNQPVNQSVNQPVTPFFTTPSMNNISSHNFNSIVPQLLNKQCLKYEQPIIHTLDSHSHNINNVELDLEERLAISRKRNREHARRTRLRKKAKLGALQIRVKDLETENLTLQKRIEECSIASILLGLSSKELSQQEKEEIASSRDDTQNGDGTIEGNGGRKNVAPGPLKLIIGGKTTFVGGGLKSYINWKKGTFIDEDGVQQHLTNDQLENLRRERNRMHAKMTRHRKKNHLEKIQKTVEDLEAENSRKKEILSKVSQKHFGEASQKHFGVASHNDGCSDSESSQESKVPQVMGAATVIA